MNDLERDAILQELRTDIKQIMEVNQSVVGVLFDNKGNPGLCSKVETQGKEIGVLKLILAVLFGSGVLAGGGIWISKLLG